jgi:hypothetical protein
MDRKYTTLTVFALAIALWIVLCKMNKQIAMIESEGFDDFNGLSGFNTQPYVVNTCTCSKCDGVSDLEPLSVHHLDHELDPDVAAPHTHNNSNVGLYEGLGHVGSNFRDHNARYIPGYGAVEGVNIEAFGSYGCWSGSKCG